MAVGSMNPPARSPHNELAGQKKQSSVLVRGFSALDIAKQAGTVPWSFDEQQFIDWLRSPATEAIAQLQQILVDNPQIPGVTVQQLVDMLSDLTALRNFGVAEFVGTGAEQTMPLPVTGLAAKNVHIHWEGVLQSYENHTIDGNNVLHFTAPLGTDVQITIS
jgi:hypothetical protein